MAEDKGEKKRPEGILVLRNKGDRFHQVVEEGGIEVIFFIESQGMDKDNVAEALKHTVIKDFKEERQIAIDEIKFHPVVEKENVYSGFVECHFASRDYRTLLYLAARYGPSAVEIIRPDHITLSQGDMQTAIADVSSIVQGLSVKCMQLMTPELRKKAIEGGLDL